MKKLLTKYLLTASCTMAFLSMAFGVNIYCPSEIICQTTSVTSCKASNYSVNWQIQARSTITPGKPYTFFAAFVAYDANKNPVSASCSYALTPGDQLALSANGLKNTPPGAGNQWTPMGENYICQSLKINIKDCPFTAQ